MVQLNGCVVCCRTNEMTFQVDIWSDGLTLLCLGQALRSDVKVQGHRRKCSFILAESESEIEKTSSDNVEEKQN